MKNKYLYPILLEFLSEETKCKSDENKCMVQELIYPDKKPEPA